MEDKFIKELEINTTNSEGSLVNFAPRYNDSQTPFLTINSIPVSNYSKLNDISSSASTLKRESLVSDNGRSKIGRQVYIGQMVLSTVWQSYDLLFKDHVISGAALVVLKKAISKVFYSCEELNLPIQFAFSSEWDSIRNQLWIYKESLLSDNRFRASSGELLGGEFGYKGFSGFFFLPSFLSYFRSKAKAKNLFLDVEVLFSFITARVDLLEQDFQELQSYLGSSSIQLFQNQIIEAQQYLDLLLSYSQEQYNVAVSHISVNILFNSLRDSMEELVKSRLLLEEDEEKLLALCEDRRFLFSSSLSREVINEYTPEN
ncbi:Sodium/hydrogen exchanger family protein [Cryptosporidium felis]|nr:Sodium/hydrogen exchanger family protein [Cryptosporidium felis]